MKWLAVAALVIVAVLIVLWKQLGSDDDVIPAAKAAKPHAEASTPTEKARDARAAAAKIAAETKPVATETKPEPGKPAKIDPMSDEFFYQVQEKVPKMLGAAAAKCYEGIAKRVHRNENVVYDFKTKIKDGVVTIVDVKVNENKITQPALETCFRQEIARVSWRDDTLPDWEGDDQLTLSPERGMKKFMQDNINYVGEPVKEGYDIAPHKPEAPSN